MRGGVLEPEVRALVEEIVSYQHGDHLGDRLSAVLLCLDAIRGQENQPRAGFFAFHRDAVGRISFR